MEQHFRKIIEGIGENPKREGLIKTPQRASRAYEFMMQGYKKNVKEIVNGAIFKSDNDEMVIVKDIEMYSMCEHHLLPFFGKAHIGYIPNGKIIGLSKVARIVDMYARRLQVQENLTKQIAATLMDVTGALGVGVVIEAKHLCMMMRGVEKQNSIMKTSCLMGVVRKDDACRKEFLSLIA